MDFRNRYEFASLFAWSLEEFSWCLSLRFSAVRFRIRAVVAKCGMPEYYGFYNGSWRFSSFTFFWKIAKNIEFQVEFRCKKSRKFIAEFPWKFDAKNMRIHKKSMKIDTRKPTFEKRGSEVRFLIDLGYFWGPVGGPKSPEVVKKGIQGGTQKTVKKTRVANQRKSSWKGNVSI